MTVTSLITTVALLGLVAFIVLFANEYHKSSKELSDEELDDLVRVLNDVAREREQEEKTSPKMWDRN